MSLVSVIIPFYKAENTIFQCLQSLFDQDFPKDQFEVLLINNNSPGFDTLDFSDFPISIFHQNIPGSYAARNLGLKKAKGETIAFTDADCIVDKKWLKHGLIKMKTSHCDLVGGQIKFTNTHLSIFHQWDALHHMDNNYTIQKRNSAATANLIVRREVFDHIGGFPEWKSSGDTYFTSKAVKKGHTLYYGEDVIVYHPSRSKEELITKRVRIGQGMAVKHKKKYGLFFTLLILPLFFTPFYALKLNQANTWRLDIWNKIIQHARLFYPALLISFATGKGYFRGIFG